MMAVGTTGFALMVMGIVSACFLAQSLRFLVDFHAFLTARNGPKGMGSGRITAKNQGQEKNGDEKAHIQRSIIKIRKINGRKINALFWSRTSRNY